MYVIGDNTLAEKLKSEGYILMKKTKIDNQDAYLFTTNNKKMNFSLEDKRHIIFTNKLIF